MKKKKKKEVVVTGSDVARICSSFATLLLLVTLIIHLCKGYPLSQASILLVLLFANISCLLCLIFMETKKR